MSKRMVRTQRPKQRRTPVTDRAILIMLYRRELAAGKGEEK